MATKPLPNTPPDQETVSLVLAWMPEGKRNAQKELDRAKRRYERKLVELSIVAVAAPVIPDATGLRPAKNEEERKLAIRKVCQDDDTFYRLEAAYQAKARDLQFYSDQQTNFRLIAELMEMCGKMPF